MFPYMYRLPSPNGMLGAKDKEICPKAARQLAVELCRTRCHFSHRCPESLVENIVSNNSLYVRSLQLAVVAMLVLGLAKGPAEASDTKTVAFLGVHLQNDNAGFEPTTDAERARMVKVENMFKAQLESTGKLHFVDVPADT